MTGWWGEHVIDTGRLPLFLCLLAFVVTFVLTRLITRSIRAGRGPFGDNVSESGLHIHHAVPGVIILICGAFLAVGAHGEPGWAELAGVLVGVGTSLVLDEFALILRLDDVYWSEEGRVPSRWSRSRPPVWVSSSSVPTPFSSTDRRASPVLLDRWWRSLSTWRSY